MFYNQAVAQKFVDCFNAKCMCDTACSYAYCMVDPDCQNLADEVSSLDDCTPCCKKCKKKLQQKFEAFACTRV